MTLAIAEANRDIALKAYTAALEGASYSINTGGTSRSLSRQQIDKLRHEYEYWLLKVSELSGRSRRVFRGVAKC
jgi:hypothetical protein